MTLNVNDSALPTGGSPAAAGDTANNGADHIDQPNLGDGTAGGTANAGDGNEPAAEPKKEKTPEQREIERLRRRVDNLTRRRYELEAAGAVPARQQQQQQQPSHADDDDEPVTLTRAELKKQIAEQAQQLAPTMRDQQAEFERRHGVVTSLAKEWGQEKFDALSADLDDALGGLVDRRGAPTAATDAIFHADDPKGVIEYLADPDNAEEAASISKMGAVQAGRAIAKLEQKLVAEKAKAKPQPSNAPAPLEPARGGGVPNGMPDPSNTKAYIAWANAQELAQR
jgi:hypothetical protein